MNSKFGKINSKNYWRGIKFVKKDNDEEEDQTYFIEFLELIRFRIKFFIN